jgi:hypothetical protein
VHPAPHGSLATDGARSMSRSFMACGDETGSATVACLFSCCDTVCEEVWETGRETLFHSGARHRGVLRGAGVGRIAACRTMARTEPPRATLDIRASVLPDALRWSDAPEPARGSSARGLVEGERESSRLAERCRLPVRATSRRPGPTVARSAPQPPRPASGLRASPLHDGVVRGRGSRGSAPAAGARGWARAREARSADPSRGGAGGVGAAWLARAVALEAGCAQPPRRSPAQTRA